jgi:hypothetical protein
MRIDDLGVTLEPRDGGQLIERSDGRVLARPGQVYAIRLRNHDHAHRAVVRVRIDGRDVTEAGLVLEPGVTIDLERPTTDRGRFTVFGEGDEDAFGEDGGRDNPDLGLVEVESRHEQRRWHPPSPARDFPFQNFAERPEAGPYHARMADVLREQVSAYDVEGAAGTALTGRSNQDFVTVRVGALEASATIIRLRIVLGRPEAFDRPRPLPGVRSNPAPMRPAPRP